MRLQPCSCSAQKPTTRSGTLRSPHGRQLRPSAAGSTVCRTAAASAAAFETAEQPCMTMPNGMSVRYTATVDEVNAIFREQYEQRVYLQHGVQVRPGDTVVDVGANVGLFSMNAAEACGPSGRVLALEPAPSTHAACAANITAHAAWCRGRGSPAAPVTLLQLAVGDGSSSEAQLTVYDGASGWSTLHEDDDELQANLETYLGHYLDAQHEVVGSGVREKVIALLARFLKATPPLRVLYEGVIRAYVTRVMLKGRQRVTVQVKTLGDLMEEQGLSQINLLKVDVERAELEVLQGIKQHQWPSIAQVACEVHDQGQRLGQAKALLQGAGFERVVVGQDEEMVGTNLYYIWASRTSAA